MPRKFSNRLMDILIGASQGARLPLESGGPEAGFLGAIAPTYGSSQQRLASDIEKERLENKRMAVKKFLASKASSDITPEERTYYETNPDEAFKQIVGEKIRAGYRTKKFQPTLTVPEKTVKPRPPLGFRWTKEGNLEAIPGGPAAIKEERTTGKEKALLKGQVQKADLIINKVDQALSKVNRFTAGFGSKFAIIPSTKARDLQSDIETIKANLGFQQLQEMRASSPTGGALGNVSEREIGLLTSAVASLDQEQSPKQLKARLQEIKDSYSRWKNAVSGSLGQEEVSDSLGQEEASDSLGQEEDFSDIQEFVNP